MDNNDPLRQTINTYDVVAPQYVERIKANGWWDSHNPTIERLQQHLAGGSTVLDLGCGPGRDSFKLRAAGYRVTGADLSWGMLTQAKLYAGNDLIQLDMRHLAFANQAFEAIWMYASLLHLPRQDAPQALSEVQRVLRPGGVLTLSVKQGDGEGYQQQLGQRFFTYYQPDEIHALAESTGLHILEHWRDTHTETPWLSLIARKP